MKNFYKIESKIPWQIKYMYIDKNPPIADRIFERRRIPVKYLYDFENEGIKYLCTFISVNKKYKEEFEDCMEELARNILISGGRNYGKICDEISERFIEENIESFIGMYAKEPVSADSSVEVLNTESENMFYLSPSLFDQCELKGFQKGYAAANEKKGFKDKENYGVDKLFVYKTEEEALENCDKKDFVILVLWQE